MSDIDFDPSDVDKANRLAYKANKLAIAAIGAVRTDNNNMLMGRDQKAELFVLATDVLRLLGVETPNNNEMNFPKDGRGIEYCDPSGGMK